MNLILLVTFLSVFSYQSHYTEGKCTKITTTTAATTLSFANNGEVQNTKDVMVTSMTENQPTTTTTTTIIITTTTISIDLNAPELIINVQRTDLVGVREYIASGLDLNVVNDMGQTALIIAAIYNRQAILKMLISANADLNVQDTNGDTALIDASNSGNIGIVRLLTNQSSVDLDIRDHMGCSAIVYAAMLNRNFVVNELIAAGADLNSLTDDGETALMFASEMGNLPIVKALVTAKADINLADKKGRTALKFALDHNKTGVAAYLRLNGAE